jgi:AraC-like DNA-binding protein
MNRPTPAQHSLPAVHVLHLAQLLKRWHVSESALLFGSGVTQEQLEDPKGTLPISTCVAIMERARSLTGEPGLGVYLGLQLRASAHGYVGFAAMTAPKLIDAIRLTIKYAPIRTTCITLRGSVEGDLGVLTVHEEADFGPARDAIVLAILVGLWQSACGLTGRELKMQMDCAFPEPTYFSRFAHALPAARFDRPDNQLAGTTKGFDLPLTLADPAAVRLAREQCDRLAESLGLHGRVAPRVRGLLAARDGVLRSLDEVARDLGMSARTLRRRLSDEGSTYALLLNDQRKESSMAMLRSRDMTVDDVAARLGYSNAANFTRAFRQWTGMTPTAYRRGTSGTSGTSGTK